MAKQTAKKKESQICIVTVTGRDRVGIIARLANTMAKANINIVDVNQKIMEGQYFVMTMACDIAEAGISMKQIHQQLDIIAKEMELNITFQNEQIFKMMHRI